MVMICFVTHIDHSWENTYIEIQNHDEKLQCNATYYNTNTITTKKRKLMAMLSVVCIMNMHYEYGFWRGFFIKHLWHSTLAVRVGNVSNQLFGMITSIFNTPIDVMMQYISKVKCHMKPLNVEIFVWCCDCLQTFPILFYYCMLSCQTILGHNSIFVLISRVAKLNWYGWKGMNGWVMQKSWTILCRYGCIAYQ